MRYGTTLPPWSAAHACTNLYDASNPGIATVPGKMRVTAVGREFDTHHIVLDPRGTPFPVLAVSHAAGKPKHYVHDLMRARADDLALQLADDDAYFYVCGLKAMEEGVVPALRGIATGAGLNWETVGAALKRDGRLHLETY
jgi:sulfite reductase alpha subunit-like flavoprotein